MDGEGIFFRNSTVRIGDVVDGTSSTLAAGERSFRYAEATWVGSVTAAIYGSPPGSPFAGQTYNAANFVLGHTGESFGGPTGPTDSNNFMSNHSSGVNFVFCDGHVRLLGSSVDYATYRALSTRSGRESISEDY